MADRWLSRFDWRYSADLTPAIDTAASSVPAGFSIYNTAGSGKIITVREIMARDRTNLELNSAPTALNTSKVFLTHSANSAAAQGDRIDAIKMDTDAPDLPAHVICGRLNQWNSLPFLTQATPDSVQTLLAVPTLQTSGANAFFNRSSSSLHGKLFSMYSMAGSQRLILNAGRATSLMLNYNVLNYVVPKMYQVSCTILVDGWTYLYRCPVQFGDDWGASYDVLNWSLQNAVGSAVIVEVVDVDIIEYTPDYDGTTFPPPTISLETITTLTDAVDLGPRVINGSQGDTIPLDSANAALPSGVRTTLGGYRDQGTINPFLRNVQRTAGFSASPLGTPAYRFPNGAPQGCSHTLFEGSFVLREGQGITMVQRDSLSSIGNWDVEVTFDVEAGAATLYSRARGGRSRSQVVNQRRAANQ